MSARIAACLLASLALPPVSAGSAQSTGAPSREDVARVAVARVERFAESMGHADASSASEAARLARVALEMAGPAAEAQLASRLAEQPSQPSASAFAWALRVALARRPDAPLPPRPTTLRALVAALSSPSWEVRMAAASTLGALGVEEASADVGRLLLAPDRPRGSEVPLLLALAGTGGPDASLVVGFLERGGGAAWSDAAIAIALRRGRAIWPALAGLFARATDPSVRAVAGTALLLLAEPRATCALVEAQANEPDPVLRRLAFQAIAAGRHPDGLDFLAQAARGEDDAELRQAATWLLAEPSRVDRRATGTRPLGDVLAEVAKGPAFGSLLAEIEARALIQSVDQIDRVLRALPLREDDRWRADHARLAQLRARLLCDGLGCAEP